MDRTVVVTGASGGIGAEVARELSRRQWRVAVVGRDPERTHAVAKRVQGIPFVCDFDSLNQVRETTRELDERFDRIDAVVNNAGGIVASHQTSEDGHELTLQRNLLGSVVLTEGLVPKLLATQGRVIHTTSMVARFGRIDLNDLDFTNRRYGAGWWPYASAKLGVILYARSLADRTGLQSYPVHPGYVRSGFGAESRSGKALLALTGWMQISPEAGAAPLVHLVDTPELGVSNGTYFDGLTPDAVSHPFAGNTEIVKAYWREVTSLANQTAKQHHTT